LPKYVVHLRKLYSTGESVEKYTKYENDYMTQVSINDSVIEFSRIMNNEFDFISFGSFLHLKWMCFL